MTSNNNDSKKVGTGIMLTLWVIGLFAKEWRWKRRPGKHICGGCGYILGTETRPQLLQVAVSLQRRCGTRRVLTTRALQPAASGRWWHEGRRQHLTEDAIWSDQRNSAAPYSIGGKQIRHDETG